MDLRRYDIIALKRLFIEQSKQLSDMLLRGLSWEATLEQRHNVTEVSKELYRRISGPDNLHPAESNLRG